jgi:uncharacterized membrane protein
MEEDVMSVRNTIIGMLALAALGAPARAAEDSPKRLIYAAYKTEDAAMEAFKALKAAEETGAIKIDSYAVITKTVDGKVKVRDQREKGTRTGAVVGALVGLLGGPMGAAVGIAAGSGTGYLAGDAVGMPRETIDMIKSSLHPGESAIIAVVDERWAAAVEELGAATAARLMTHPIPLAQKGHQEKPQPSGPPRARPAPPPAP